MKKSVREAADERLDLIFREFDRVYLSFSGGKDSSVLLHLALAAARRAGRLPLDVLVIDLEAQYTATIEHALDMVRSPDVRPWWVCLPINLRNAVSTLQPFWWCWDPERRDQWVRQPPPEAITDPTRFPFFRPGMEFEDFVPEFGEWFADGARTACLVGIRTQESLNRWRALTTTKKDMYQGAAWTTRMRSCKSADLYNAYPIYDWTTEDIWVANAREGWAYNSIYDLMHLAGVSIHEQRICQPYGDDQRRGLWLYHLLEPETWARVVSRVSGANFGAGYCGDPILGNRFISLPPGHTWKTYAHLLLDTMPPEVRAHYQSKIAVFLNWYAKHYPDRYAHDIPDAVPEDFESNKERPTGKKPSWERICKTLLKNDWVCKSLTFSMTKRDEQRRHDLRQRYEDL